MMLDQMIDRRDGFRLIAAAGAGALLCGSKAPPASAGEISVEKIPAILRTAAEHLVKGAKWKSATVTKEEEELLYELFGEDASKLSLSIEITSGGKVVSFEREIEISDLPKAVTATVAERFPKLKPQNVLAVYHGDDIRNLAKDEHTYQLNGDAAKGKDLTVEISSAGKVIEVKREIELADVPKSVSEALSSKAPKFQTEIVHKVTRENTVVGYLFASKNRRVAFISSDGKEIEIHKED